MGCKEILMALLWSRVPTGPYGGSGRVFAEENRVLVYADKGPNAGVSNTLHSESTPAVGWDLFNTTNGDEAELHLGDFLMRLLQDLSVFGSFLHACGELKCHI